MILPSITEYIKNTCPAYIDGLDSLLMGACWAANLQIESICRKERDMLHGLLMGMPGVSFERELVAFLSNHWFGSRYILIDSRLAPTTQELIDASRGNDNARRRR